MGTGAAWTFEIVGNHGMSDNTWYHIALVRNGTAAVIYIDGVSVASGTNNPATSITSALALNIGANPAGTAYPLFGWMSSIKISKGIARWTAAFTPATIENQNRTNSSYHSGAAGWERLTVSKNIEANNTRLRVEMQVNTGNTDAYFDGGLLVEGDNDIYVMTDSVDISDWKPTNTYRSQKFTVSRREGARIPNVILDERSLKIRGKVIGSTANTARTTWDTFLNRLNHNRYNPASEHTSKNLYLFEDRFLTGVIQKITPDFEGALGVVNFDVDFVCANPFYNYLQKKRKTTTMALSPQTFTVTPTGNAFTRPTIKVTAGGANITLVTVKNLTTSQSWSYSGTITAGESLVLDTEELTLENDGANAFSSFSGEPQMILTPGDNLFVVTFTGGSTDSVIRVDYYDRWY
jgi:hypothetical protein